ncbi:hypothetical protein HDE_00850 [Halotydeus destructor]|nr:hypothetical protein HDE_00850 [Halotydeus destructor]
MSSERELEAAWLLLQLSEEKSTHLPETMDCADVSENQSSSVDEAPFSLHFEPMETIGASSTETLDKTLSCATITSDGFAVPAKPVVLLWLVSASTPAANPSFAGAQPAMEGSQRRLLRKKTGKTPDILFKKSNMTRLNPEEKKLIYQHRLERKVNPKGGVMKPSDVSKTKAKLSHLSAERTLKELEEKFEEVTKTSVKLHYQAEGLTLKRVEDDTWSLFGQEHPDEDIFSLRIDNRSARRAKAETALEKRTRLTECNRKAAIRSRVNEKVDKSLIAMKRISVQRALKNAGIRESRIESDE